MNAPAFTDGRTPGADLDGVDLVLRLIELLAASREPRGVTSIATELRISKPRAHRHLRALVARGYATQDPASEGYEIGVKLLSLAESVRGRFDVIAAIRPSLGPLREGTGMAVTASALQHGDMVVLEMINGVSPIEFGVRPGSRLDLHASAHGLAALAFGPPELLASALAGPRRAWTASTLVNAKTLVAEVERVRAQGWASAPDAVQIGVGALAAPVLDHRGMFRGAVAIVGATASIEYREPGRQVAAVCAAARQASARLGWECG